MSEETIIARCHLTSRHDRLQAFEGRGLGLVIGQFNANFSSSIIVLSHSINLILLFFCSFVCLHFGLSLSRVSDVTEQAVEGHKEQKKRLYFC